MSSPSDLRSAFTRRDLLSFGVAGAAYLALGGLRSALAYCAWEQKHLPKGVCARPWWTARLPVDDPRRRQNMRIPAAPVDANRFTFGSDGTFTFFHLSDVHHERKVMAPREKVFFAKMCEKFRPSLAIMTGDNTNWRCRGLFDESAGEVVKLFTDEKLPFAITFGNHDTELVGEGWYDVVQQWSFYREAGGRYFVDRHDASVLGGGTSRIQVLGADGKARFDLNVLDSGDYAPQSDLEPNEPPPEPSNWKYGSCDSVRAPQVAWARKTLSEGVPSLFFQHIIVPEANERLCHGLLEYAKDGEQPSLTHEYFGKRPVRVNPKRAAGYIVEGLGSVKPQLARHPVYLDQGESIYEVWRKAPNFRGAYFGHDHKNTFDGVTEDGVRMGYCKTPCTCAYNDDDLGLRVFRLHADGSYETDVFTEKHPNGSGFWGRPSPLG